MKLEEISPAQLTEAELRKREVEALEKIATNMAYLSEQTGIIITKLNGIEHGINRAGGTTSSYLKR